MDVMHIWRTKGRVALRRSLLIIGRYGFGSSKLKRNMTMLASLLRKYRIGATIPVPAVIYARRRAFLDGLSDVIEYAVHGYRHTDHSELDESVCLEHTARGKEILGAAGFRVPNHKSSDALVRCLNKNGYVYDSSEVIVTDPSLYTNKQTSNIISFYSKAKFDVPHLKGKVLEIPVSLPDDEILTDRLGCSNAQILGIWKKMLQNCIARKGVFVLQLHPERFFLLRGILEALIVYARQNKIPIKTLGEVANDWKKGLRNSCFCITGDLDFFSLYEKVFVI